MATTAFLSLYGGAFLLLAGVWARRISASPAAAGDVPLRFHFAVLVALGVALRLPLLWDAGFHYDTGTYKAWALTLSDPQDPFNVYKEGYFADYPPLYMYVLAALGALARLGSFENSAHFTALIKLPALIADLATSLLLLGVLRQRLGERRALWAAALYWLNPLLIFNGALWGQTDAILCLLIVSAWLAWQRDRLVLAAVLLAAAVAFKPQGALYAGVFGIAALFGRDHRRVGLALLAALACFVLIALPFAATRPWHWLPSLYLKTAGTYDYITVNAYNLWALLGWNWKKDVGSLLGLPMQTWAMLTAVLLLSTLAVATGLRLRRERDESTRAGVMAWAFALATIAFFMLAPRMHERYIVMLLPMLFLLDARRLHLPLILLWTVAALANVAYVYYHYIDRAQIAPADTSFIRASAAFNLGLALLTVLYGRAQPWAARAAAGWRSPVIASRLPVEAALGRDSFQGGRTARERWQHRHTLLLIAFTVAALTQSLYRLGALDYPVSGLQTDSFTVEYRYEQPIEARVALVYAGENSAELSLERHVDGRWQTAIPAREFKDFYATHEIVLESPGPARRYRWRASGAGWRINELVLLDAGGAALLPDGIGESTEPAAAAQRLFDEPAAWVRGRGYLAGTYFDEIYHGRTAYEYLHRLPVYETTHPPLGKWLISLGIEAAGMTPFGWRLAGAISAALTVGALAWGGWLLGGAQTMLLAGGLGLFEFSRYTLGRFATIDSFLGLFLLLCLLCLWRQFGIAEQRDWRAGWRFSPWLLGAGASLGAAIATKWSALYAGVAIFLFFLASLGSTMMQDDAARWRRAASQIGVAALAFALVPTLIYILSYVPFLRCLPDAPSLFSAEGLREVLKSQRDMYDYHARLTSTHPFSSAFWSWPLMLGPLWLYVSESGGLRSSITLLGNPVIWWGGGVALLATLWRALRLPTRRELLLLCAYASVYLPWALVGRVSFIYHYYPAALVLILLLSDRLGELAAHRRLRWLPATALLLAAAMYAAFYPAISGMPASPDRSSFLRWLPGWWMI